LSGRLPLWLGFHAFVLVMLVLDLGVFQRRPRAVSAREGAAWTAIWVGLSLCWGGGLSLWMSPARGVEFFTAYAVEYALSIDNLFVFLVLFAYFQVPPALQHRLLFWGILAEFAMRAPLIIGGTQAVQRFHWVLYLLGAFLIYTAVRTAVARGESQDPERGWIVRLTRRVLPLSRSVETDHFLVLEGERLKFTRLFLVLVVLNVTDLMFAIDSIPAVLGVTQDAFVAYASNVCAIFGLRSLFFLVASLMDRLRFLKVAISAILALVGAKMIASHWIEVPTAWSLGAIGVIVLVATVASAIWPAPNAPSAS
jgi:tellurite resistance protein TerC